MTIKGTFLWYRWRYLLGQSLFFDPYSRYLNLILRRVTKEDQQQKQQNKTPAVSETVGKENSMLTTTDAIHGLQDLVQSRGLRLTAVGITSSLAALILTGRIRSVRQELRQEHELHVIRQEQQRQQRQSDQEGDRDYQSANILFKEKIRIIKYCLRHQVPSLTVVIVVISGNIIVQNRTLLPVTPICVHFVMSHEFIPLLLLGVTFSVLSVFSFQFANVPFVL